LKFCISLNGVCIVCPCTVILFSFSEKFAEVLQKQQNERLERNRERIRMMNANPFDPDVQKKIAEEIR